MELFKGCTSLQNIDSSILDFSKMRKMVSLDKMNFKQIEWCKEKLLIENIKRETSKQLNICAYYAIIEPEDIKHFDSL
jgi:hypothetical protein|tara:strand:- start:101 stop:334 length:234 start_codon:yes stop_codon:yes gene_type:complete